jgi:peptidoglycan-N-acetylglucosamine deacetylase
MSVPHTAECLGWLNGKAAALVLSFDVDAEAAVLAYGRRYADHAMVMTHQAYGPLVGVPRLLQLLADCSVKATFFIPGLTTERYPDMVERVAQAGHEIGHHSFSHRSAVTLTSDEERRDFELALEALRRVGVRPLGHRAALWEASWQTAALVAEYGLLYDSSLMNDDRPYVLETGERTVIELPPHWSLDDWEQYAYLPQPAIGHNIESTAKVLELWTSELDAMRRHHCLCMLTCHPFLSGRPSRVEALRRFIEFARARDDVDIVTGAELARRAAADPCLVRRPAERPNISATIYPEL